MSEYGPIHPDLAAYANRLLGRPEDQPLTVRDVMRAAEIERGTHSPEPAADPTEEGEK